MFYHRIKGILLNYARDISLFLQMDFLVPHRHTTHILRHQPIPSLPHNKQIQSPYSIIIMYYPQPKHPRPHHTDLLISTDPQPHPSARTASSSFPTPNPQEPPSAAVQKLILSLRTYRPISDLLALSFLQGKEIKRYRESLYWGQLVNGKRHGQGVMLYPGGRIFQGNWADNLRSGQGFQRYSNGATYLGAFARGKPEGCGRYEQPNGEVYQGEWKAGLKHGSGIWRGPKGDSYIGQWQQGRAQGYGVHTWTNGDRYQGEFVNCLKHGEGVQRFANGDTYKGNYQAGYPSGYGEYYWSSGSFFKGNFKNGLRNGQGVWKKGPGRSDKYQGEWVRDKKEGYGVFTWADGRLYKGKYVNDLREGFGEMAESNGRVYRGNWRADQQVDQQQNIGEAGRIEGEIEHDEECELFIPSPQGGYFPPPPQPSGAQINPMYDHPFTHTQTRPSAFPYYPEQDLPQPPPLYHQPHPPAILKSSSRNFRPRSLLKSGSRGDHNHRSRVESQSNHPQSQGRPRGMSKKLSVGTVSGGKGNPYVAAAGRSGLNNQKMLASSFFLYKMTTGRGEQGQGQGRQVRTSGGSRGRPSGGVDEELKYFARSKISSFSQLQ